jgi:predicted kinase
VASTNKRTFDLLLNRADLFACPFSFITVLFFHEQALRQIDYYRRYLIGGIALDLKVRKQPAQKAGFCFLGSYRGFGNMGRSRSGSDEAAVLHMVCGKIASGKSTLTKRLARSENAVVISEDSWMVHLYPGEIHTLDDYGRCSGRIRRALSDHVQALLSAGMSVILDFPFNTINSRAWGRELFDGAGVGHRLHYLDVSDVICKTRLRARNASGEHPFETTDAQFDQITQYFVPPSAIEEFQIVLHTPG